MSDQGQLPRSSRDPADARPDDATPDPMTDPVTGPVARRLERFHDATSIQPPIDIAVRVRERLARESLPAPRVTTVSPSDIQVTLRRRTEQALGRGGASRPARAQALALAAVLILAVGVAAVAGVIWLRSTTDQVGGPTVAPTMPLTSPSLAPSPRPSPTSTASPRPTTATSSSAAVSRDSAVSPTPRPRHRTRPRNGPSATDEAPEQRPDGDREHTARLRRPPDGRSRVCLAVGRAKRACPRFGAA